MKKFVFLAAFTTVNAFACPDLTGSYQCNNEDGQSIIQIQQSEENGSTAYAITTNGEVSYVIPDNTEYTGEDGTKVRMWCESNQVRINIQAVDTEAGPWVANLAYYQDESKNLVNDISITLKSTGENFKTSDVCSKL